ncbi:LOW QUALITY PROTEIN: hypothetical protein TorRG33x02_280790 [Trema orientale]|uniref:Uncharacterized protein n=1 Tax=Trema orientale TaxID=63057 RepID=A0A2P5CLJ7_TREOI|nr:LOW QUALITY PROTEIN: hypothetical protein TorRG33x02_280790 [Trema orientale]
MYLISHHLSPLNFKTDPKFTISFHFNPLFEFYNHFNFNFNFNSKFMKRPKYL